MRIGQDQPVGADDEARAFASDWLLLLGLEGEVTEERRERTVAERIGVRCAIAAGAVAVVIVAVLVTVLGERGRDLLEDLDVDHRRAVLFHHGAEVRQHGLGIAGRRYCLHWRLDSVGGRLSPHVVRVERAQRGRDQRAERSCGERLRIDLRVHVHLHR